MTEREYLERNLGTLQRFIFTWPEVVKPAIYLNAIISNTNCELAKM